MDKSTSLPLEPRPDMASGSTLEGIQISAMTQLIDLDFTLSQMYRKVESAVSVIVWPFEKIHDEVLHAVRELTRKRNPPTLKQRVSFHSSMNVRPFFVHMLITTKDDAVRVYVCDSEEEFDSNDIPVYSFCYR